MEVKLVAGVVSYCCYDGSWLCANWWNIAVFYGLHWR